MAVNCNTCESDNKKYLFNKNKHAVVKCTDCGLVYIENPMSLKETKKHYEQEYYTGKNGAASTSCYASGEEFRSMEANKRLDKLPSVHYLLDVGCGMGHFVMASEKRGIKSIGADISENAVEYGKSKGLNLIQGDLLSLDNFAEESFDMITFWASIEHLHKPKQTLLKAHNLLKKYGMLIIETGDINSYQALFFRNNWRLIKPDHNFYYSSATLDHLLTDTGFKTIHTEHDGFVEGIIAQLNLSDLVLNKFAESSKESKKATSSLKIKVNEFASNLHLGDVMIKYAVKN